MLPIINSIKALVRILNRYLSPLMGRAWGRLFVLFIFMGAVNAYAQTAPIPNPGWPLDSVINGAIKHFSVQGDLNYSEPSTFTWTVYGGRLFFDQDTLLSAGDGSTVTVLGDSSTNTTEIWVVWDVFTEAIDYGYIFVTEVSADGCQKFDSDESKFQGLNIKVKAPPDVRFLTNETLTCSNEQGILVEIEIKGFAPFNIVYSYNGEIRNWHVEPGEMIDSDFDGKENNLVIPINDYTGTTVDRIYQLELISAESEGVYGDVLQYPVHTVYAFVQPDAPVISPDWTEVTTGESHTISLSDLGVDPAEWIWELYDEFGFLVYETSSTNEFSASVSFDFDPGDYKLLAYFRSENGCFSLADTLGITIYPTPIIGFANTSDHAIGCSAVSMNPDDSFEFALDYLGALSFDFTYGIYDFNDNLLEEISMPYQMTRDLIISIPNTFINDLFPEINRVWSVKIINAMNGEGVPVEIVDGIRTITIHPKPIIVDDIDFAN